MPNPTPYQREDLDLKTLGRSPFIYYYRRYWRQFVAGVLGLAATDVLDAIPPLIIMKAIDQLTHGAKFTSIASTAALFLGLTTLTAFTRYIWRLAWGKFEQSVGDDLRRKIFAKCTRLGPSFYHKTPIGHIMSLVTNDNTAFRMAIGPGTLVLLDGIFILAFTLPAMAWLSWSLTWKTLILMPLLPFIIRRVESLIHKYFRDQQEWFAALSANTQEIVSGIRVIKAFAQQDHHLSNFNRISRSYKEAANRSAQLDALFNPVMEFGVTSGIVILLFLVSSPNHEATTSIGAFVAFFQYIRKMSWPMTAIGLGITMQEEGRASFERIDQLLQTDIDHEYIGSKVIENFKTLEVRNLTFQYETDALPALKDISFCVNRGETLGIVGPVGAGKSTLSKLITRQYSLPEKTLYINGTPLEEINEEHLRTLIAVVPQEPFLFSQSIRDNLSLGLPEAPEFSALRSICQQVNLHSEIAEIPGEFDAELGERGVNLSGGQKQRLTIARALIRKSPITIFDDALSAVDTNTEAAILQELHRPKKFHEETESTSIIITHRLASVRFADKILVLNNGQVEAFGNHEYVAQMSPTYRDLCRLQDFPLAEGSQNGGHV